MGPTLCKTVLGLKKDFILPTISMQPGAPTTRFVSVRVKTFVSVALVIGCVCLVQLNAQ